MYMMNSKRHHTANFYSLMLYELSPVLKMPLRGRVAKEGQRNKKCSVYSMPSFDGKCKHRLTGLTGLQVPG